jgi:capsular polysaccharide transport system permease protein
VASPAVFVDLYTRNHGKMQQTSAEPTEFSQVREPQEPKSRRFRTVRVVMALILREIGSRDSRSSLGFLWSIIDPIATVAILSLAFALFTRTPRLGTNFPLYYVTGIVPFHIYTQISNRVSGSIRYSRQLLGFPAVTVMDALIARFLLNYFINIIVFIILSYGVVHYYDLRVNVRMPSVILAIVMAGSLAIGVGTFNSVLFIMFPTYDYLWGMLNRPMTIASGVLILIDDLPDWLFHILWWNPPAHLVAEMRHGFYPFYDTSWVSPFYVFMFSAIAFVLGLITLQRYVYDALDR